MVVSAIKQKKYKRFVSEKVWDIKDASTKQPRAKPLSLKEYETNEISRIKATIAAFFKAIVTHANFLAAQLISPSYSLYE
ncbi:hypothetical protein CTM75_03010 [Photobacterium phosphoreum]|nr:hypothetical protein CTM75_03010 [Photobacterium phosphoreum]